MHRHPRRRAVRRNCERGGEPDFEITSCVEKKRIKMRESLEEASLVLWGASADASGGFFLAPIFSPAAPPCDAAQVSHLETGLHAAMPAR